MKNINFLLIISFILGVVGTSYGQSAYEESEYFPSNGEDELQSAMNLSSDLLGLIEKLSPKGGMAKTLSTNRERVLICWVKIS